MKRGFHASGICDCCDGPPDEAEVFHPNPDFAKCGNCGADAATTVYWNPTGGWSCSACGAFDYPEAAA